VWYVLGFLAVSSSLRAEQVLVQRVEGQVSYGAGDSQPTVPVKAGQRLSAGIFSASDNGVVYLSTFAGSELRLGQSGTLRFEGTEEACQMGHAASRRSTFRLMQGRLRVTLHYIGPPAHCYRIELEHGIAFVESGQCVMCMHGFGTYIYVARGVTLMANAAQLAPVSAVTLSAARVTTRSEIATTPAIATKVLTGNGNVGVVGTNGSEQVEPLSAISLGEQNCLLAGLNAEGAGASGRVRANASDTVSPIQ
jgi:hypothetical protein